MSTPYDGKIYLVQVKGSFLPRKSLGDVSRIIVDTMPNVDGVFLQTSQGKEWQSKFDNDPKAVESAAKNAALNHVADKVRLRRSGLADLTEQADIVTANLDLKTLREHRNVLLSLFRRFLIVSGVPLNQWAEAKALLLAPGVVPVREITRSEWGCGLFGRT